MKRIEDRSQRSLAPNSEIEMGARPPRALFSAPPRKTPTAGNRADAWNPSQAGNAGREGASSNARGGRAPQNSDCGFTLHELLVVMFAVAVLALLAVRGMAQAAKQAPRIQCADNLKQVSAAFRIWAGDHSDRYPQQVSTLQGGAMNNGATVLPANTYTIYRCMSNELAIPKIVVCPSDGERMAATNFNAGAFNNLKVSYWVGKDAYQTMPQMFLSGDRNVYGNSASVASPTAFILASYGNSPVSPSLAGSLIAIGTNASSTLNPPPVGFTDRMHGRAGNVAMADGSMQQLTSLRFYATRAQTGDSTGTAPGKNTILFP